jgi:hypothetical protein
MVLQELRDCKVDCIHLHNVVVVKGSAVPICRGLAGSWGGGEGKAPST